MLRLFDPDIAVQDWQPNQLSFPLWAFVNLHHVNSAAQDELRQRYPTEGNRPLVLLCAHDVSQVPYRVRVWHPEPNRGFWIPWQACSPDLTLLPN